MLQSELRACQQKQQQQQVAFESTIAVLQSDMTALRSKLSDSQNGTRAASEQLRTEVNLQLEKQQQELEEQMQSMQRDASSTIAHLRQEVAARSSEAGETCMQHSLLPDAVFKCLCSVNLLQVFEQKCMYLSDHIT